jgi:hypothetical protein
VAGKTLSRQNWWLNYGQFAVLSLKMDLEFSKCFAHTSALDCRWSPSGRHLASASKYQLIVRDENLEILHIFACQEIVEEMHWAPDSQSLLCLSLSKNVVEVFSLLDTEWRATIDEESLLPGVTAVRWAPDSKHLIIVSDFQVPISSLLTWCFHPILTFNLTCSCSWQCGRWQPAAWCNT